MKFNFDIAEILKSSNRIFGSIAIATSVMLILPESICQVLYLQEFRLKYGVYISILFIITWSILIVEGIIRIYDLLKKGAKGYIAKYKEKKFLKQGSENLRNLEKFQKAIVYLLFTSTTHTQKLPMNDGAVRFLLQSMIIAPTTNQVAVTDIQNPKRPYMLQPWVITKLKEEKDLEEIFKKAHKAEREKIEEYVYRDPYYLDFY